MTQSAPEKPIWNWVDALLLIGATVPSVLAALLLSQALFIFLPSPPSDAVRALTAQFSAYALWFASLWLLLKLRYDEPFWASLGWRVPWPRMGLTLMLGPLLVVSVALLGELMHTPVIDNAIQRLLRDRLSIVLVGFFATTLGPLAEELIFRGFFQPLAIRATGVVAGISLASLPFALLHGPQYSWSWRHILLLFLASATFGAVRHLARSTAASTLVHAAYNLTFYIGFLLQRKDLLLNG